MPHQIIWSWYTGRWWVSCYVWYSEEGLGGAAALLAVPNVTAHPSTASVPINVLLYDGPLLCSFNVAIKGLMAWRERRDVSRLIWKTYDDDWNRFLVTLPREKVTNKVTNSCDQKQYLTAGRRRAEVTTVASVVPVASLVQERSRINRDFRERSLTKRFVPTIALSFFWDPKSFNPSSFSHVTRIVHKMAASIS